MGNLQQSSRHLSGGWFSFWAAVLLILPNCGFSTSVSPGHGRNLNPGDAPHTNAVFCDIEMVRYCATPAELAIGTRLASAAVALVAGQAGTNVGLDDSPEALARCAGVPEAVVFHEAFPRGTWVCLNCSDVFPSIHQDAAAVCQAQCHDLFGTLTADSTVAPDKPPTAETIAFCSANARVSTNHSPDGCFRDACTPAGTRRMDFLDPRRLPEQVIWVNLNGVSTTAPGNLTRTAPTTGFSDAGASSIQLIAKGDAYLEFTATETNTARTVGLSSGPPPPGFITFNDIGFGLLLLDNGEILALENGLSVGNFGPYAAGDKFRLKLRTNHDGTATVSYARITGPCEYGSPCNETVFHTSPNAITYPVRIDAMFREQGGTVTEAHIAYIH
jgi:hypothetical protein